MLTVSPPQPKQNTAVSATRRPGLPMIAARRGGLAAAGTGSGEDDRLGQFDKRRRPRVRRPPPALAGQHRAGEAARRERAGRALSLAAREQPGQSGSRRNQRIARLPALAIDQPSPAGGLRQGERLLDGARRGQAGGDGGGRHDALGARRPGESAARQTLGQPGIDRIRQAAFVAGDLAMSIEGKRLDAGMAAVDGGVDRRPADQPAQPIDPQTRLEVVQRADRNVVAGRSRRPQRVAQIARHRAQRDVAVDLRGARRHRDRLRLADIASRSRMERVRLCSSTLSKSYRSIEPMPSRQKFFTTSLPIAPAPKTATRIGQQTLLREPGDRPMPAVAVGRRDASLAAPAPRTHCRATTCTGTRSMLPQLMQRAPFSSASARTLATA